jgi:hypothetical protein
LSKHDRLIVRWRKYCQLDEYKRRRVQNAALCYEGASAFQRTIPFAQDK